ncbi:hypothetical protein NC651_006261 [Populus alba x Populus x berolinensis]|nr:hypothetical protein NC651_006261 [Populus alba x Populus x berolinensis]
MASEWCSSLAIFPLLTSKDQLLQEAERGQVFDGYCEGANPIMDRPDLVQDSVQVCFLTRRLMIFTVQIISQ